MYNVGGRAETYVHPEFDILLDLKWNRVFDCGTRRDPWPMSQPALCIVVHITSLNIWAELTAGSRSLLPGGTHGGRYVVHLTVSLPGDTGSVVSGFQDTINDIFFALITWLLDGQTANKSTKMVCCYE